MIHDVFVIYIKPIFGFLHTTVSCHKFKALGSQPECDLPRAKDLIHLSRRRGRGWGIDSRMDICAMMSNFFLLGVDLLLATLLPS